ncbi:MAG: helix-turn-helix domain-containing protein [Arachnia sp.]
MARNGAATRERFLQAAERLVIDNGFAATSLDQLISTTKLSKGAFFHHFDSKLDLARALVERYADADISHLEMALTEVAAIPDASDRLISFIRIFEDSADELMGAQSSCLYVAILTERQLVETGTSEGIGRAIAAWRNALSELIKEAVEARRPDWRDDLDPDALADHVFVTFEGAFILCRAEGDGRHMRAQLTILRQLLEALIAKQ